MKLDPAVVERRARGLYEACPTPKPTWDQIGDVTKSVWIDRAELAILFGDDLPAPEPLCLDDLF